MKAAISFKDPLLCNASGSYAEQYLCYLHIHITVILAVYQGPVAFNGMMLIPNVTRSGQLVSVFMELCN
jgi:hypothetical protein